MLTISEDTIIDTPKFIDQNIILGYSTGRQIQSLTLRIGRDAYIRSGTIIYVGSTIGDEFETGHNVVIREENHIGNKVDIWTNSIIDYGCHIGNNVKIHSNVYVAQYTQIEDDVFLAPGVTIANDMHPLCGLCMSDLAPKINRGARVGVNATILPGVVIGEYALVGAGSVVTHSILPYSVAYGNPARANGKVMDLTCPDGLVDQPYFHGLDVKTRA